MTTQNPKCDATINGINDCTNNVIYKQSVLGNFCQPCYEKTKKAENWLYENYKRAIDNSDKTVRLNLLVTTPYGADFDGDKDIV